MVSKTIICHKSWEPIAVTSGMEKISHLKIKASRENTGAIFAVEGPFLEKGGHELGPSDQLSLGGWTSKEARHLDLGGWFLFAEKAGDSAQIIYSIKQD